MVQAATNSSRTPGLKNVYRYPIIDAEMKGPFYTENLRIRGIHLHEFRDVEINIEVSPHVLINYFPPFLIFYGIGGLPLRVWDRSEKIHSLVSNTIASVGKGLLPKRYRFFISSDNFEAVLVGFI